MAMETGPRHVVKWENKRTCKVGSEQLCGRRFQFSLNEWASTLLLGGLEGQGGRKTVRVLACGVA